MFMYETKVDVGTTDKPNFVEALAILFNANKPVADTDDCDVLIYKKDDNTITLKVGDKEIDGTEAVG